VNAVSLTTAGTTPAACALVAHFAGPNEVAVLSFEATFVPQGAVTQNLAMQVLYSANGGPFVQLSGASSFDGLDAAGAHVSMSAKLDLVSTNSYAFQLVFTTAPNPVTLGSLPATCHGVVAYLEQ
jgi:hypothetical protein